MISIPQTHVALENRDTNHHIMFMLAEWINARGRGASTTVQQPWHHDGVARPSAAFSTATDLHLPPLIVLKTKAERKGRVVHSQSLLQDS
jgi:hypothetical protein